MAADAATRRDWFGLADFTPAPRFVRDGACCYLLERVGSTSDFLLGRGPSATGRYCTWESWGWQARPLARLAPVSAAVVGTLVAARTQTAGRGRQGRSWLDCGGLQMSCVLPAHRADFDRGFSVWMGLMVVLALRDTYGLDARLKWPNDLVVGGRKLGGLIVDRIARGDETSVVAGLGLNLTADAGRFPAELQGRATSVWLESGLVLRPGEVATTVVARIDAELDRFRDAGWSAFTGDFVRCDAIGSREVFFRTADEEIFGRSDGIDEKGALQVITADGRRRSFRAGDVHVARVLRG